MNDTISTQRRTPTETPIRLLVLGAVYAGAVFFAVALSPAMGFLAPSPAPAKIASVQTR